MITSLRMPFIHNGNKSIASISWHKLIIYSVLYILLVGSIILGCFGLLDLSELIGNIPISDATPSYRNAIDIILNNSKNYIGYLILYPVYPLLIFMDIVYTAWSIVVSIYGQGIGRTFLLLAPHGIIEIPNFILYTYLSCSSFYHFYQDKNPSIRGYLKGISYRRKYYITSFICIVIAGVIEGLLTPLI